MRLHEPFLALQPDQPDSENQPACLQGSKQNIQLPVQNNSNLSNKVGQASNQGIKKTFLSNCAVVMSGLV